MKVLHPLEICLKNINKLSIQYNQKVSLLAVTKKTDHNKVQELFDLGQRNFGENYVDELISKSLILPKEISWHLIGHLQSNKVKKLLDVKNLTTIESVDSFTLANTINKQCEKLNRFLNIYIQVNISQEVSKSGCLIDNVINLYQDITNKCTYLKVKGIMALGTVGSIEEFKLLYDLKTKISNQLKISKDEIIISNGTSSDYEDAIKYGSNEVRLGSILFDKKLQQDKTI